MNMLNLTWISCINYRRTCSNKICAYNTIIFAIYNLVNISLKQNMIKQNKILENHNTDNIINIYNRSNLNKERKNKNVNELLDNSYAHQH